MRFSKIRDSLTFDDVILLPQTSDVVSRTDVDISMPVGKLHLKVPIFSANMDTITGYAMAAAMGAAGAAGILHRFMPEEAILKDLMMLQRANLPVIPSVGVNAADLESARKYLEFTRTICLDIAHGDSKVAFLTAEKLRNMGYETVIAGNVCTGDGVLGLWNAGADVIKVGVAPGAVCTTKFVTGHGRPQLTAIMDAAETIYKHDLDASIIADGGIKNSGDIVKALAAGASAVMVGRALAGTNEALGGNTYRGMASADAQLAFRGRISNDAAEGKTILVQGKGSAEGVIKQLAGGIRSGLSYSGVRNIPDLQVEAIFERVTSTYGLSNWSE